MFSQKVLEKFKECRELFEAALWSEQYQDFIASAIEDIDFYEGRQWSQSDLETIEKAGLRPVTVNLIAQRIDALAGKEASTRTRFRYKSRSGDDASVQRADDMSALGLFLQERNRTSRILTEAKHQARITGLSWHAFEVIDGAIKETLENPLEVVWDSRDHTPLLTNQGFVARVKWMPLKEAQQRFPKRAEELEKASNESTVAGMATFGFSAQYGTLDSRYKLYALGGYWNEKEREIAIIEMQYREPETYYTYATEQGLYTTFDKEEAEKNAIDKKNIVEGDGQKVYYCYFVGNIDLEHFEAPYQLNKEQGWFTLTPNVLARGMRDGKPYGLVSKAKDSQRLYNTKQAKINWLLAARTVVMDEGAVKDIGRTRREINNPNGIIEVKPGKRFDISNHATEIAQHYQALEVHKRDIEQAMGIYDEALGVETNAQSGVAIQRRQTASASTQIYSQDGFNEAQRQVAEKMLALIQNVITERTAIEVTDDEGITKRITFNETVKGENGKEVKQNDVRLGKYDVVIEQIPDSDTMNEVAQQRMLELIQAGFTPDKWTPGILDLWNVPKNARIRKEIEAGLQQSMAQLEQLKASQNIGDAQAAPMPSGGNPAIQPMGMSM